MRFKFLISVVVLGLAFIAGINLALNNRDTTSPNITGLLWPDPPVLKAFSLVDHRGNAFTERELRARWSLIFFGFTNCPDICPTTLATLNQVYEQLRGTDDVFERVQVLFVSVDPERDNNETLHSYIDYFNSDFIAATANKEDLDQFTRQFGVAHMKVKIAGSASYSMDHTASVLLVDPQLRFVGIFSRPHETTDITTRFLQIVSFVESAG